MAKRFEKKKTVGSGDGVSTTVDATGSVTQEPPPWLRRDWLWSLLLILAVFLVYQPVWHAGFIWDDENCVTANLCIVGPLGLKEIWTTNAADICPLTITTFWVEHALWGLAPLPYHLVNVLLHGACAVALWRVLRSLQMPGAWLGAALWALHPVQVESVAWIAEMKNTESGLFFLISILFFVRWLKARNLQGRTGNNWNYELTLLFAALALASKSSTVILPAVLCLCAWWMEGRWQWRNLARVAPVFLMSVVAGVVSMWTQKIGGGGDPQWAQTWPERLVTAGDAVWFYLGKLVWPYPLSAIYPRWQIDAGQWFSYLPLLAAIIVLLILWLNRESWFRPWFFVFAYFLAALFPVLGLFEQYFQRYSFVADHFQYLAGMGPLALAGAGLFRLADFAIPGRPWAQPTLCAGLLLVLGMLSWQRAWAYGSDEALWTDTLAKNENCWMARNNLGLALEKKGQLDEAMEQYKKALEINPTYDLAHDNLGKVLAQKGQIDEAVAQFKMALETNPASAQPYNNLGTALLQKGQLDKGIAQVQKALEINPYYADAYNNLGWALLQKGQADEAIVQFQKGLKISPNYAEAHYNLGNALLQKGEVSEAIAQYEKALEINPGFAGVYNNLGWVLLQKGRVDEASVQFQKALDADPNYELAHNNLGIALLNKGQVAEAIVQFQEALRLKPGDVNAQNNLAKAQAMARPRALPK